MSKFDWYPPLLYSDDTNKILIFKNVGVILTKYNKPADVGRQFNKILKDMESVNVEYNDIKEGELLIDKNEKNIFMRFLMGSINKNMDCGIVLCGCENIDKPCAVLSNILYIFTNIRTAISIIR